MAKQQIYQFENGATLIFQKQSAFNGYSFAIGFRSGSQLDGKYKGLSHALEHMLSKAPDYESTKTLLDNMLKYTINANAFTSEHSICVSTFSAADKNINEALQLTHDMLKRKTFSADQLKKELEVIKQEILMYKDQNLDELPSAFDVLIGSLCPDLQNTFDILGNSKTLKLITPDLLKLYMDRYFNSNNLVISVTTNKSIESVVSLCNKYIFSVVKPATSPEFIITPPPAKQFKEINTLVALPNMDVNTLSLCILLRERSCISEDINLEYAYDTIEEYIMNNSGGLLWDILREKNSLVYTYSLHNLDYETAKFKSFQALTSPSKMRKTISEICGLIRNIGLYGIPKDKFNDVINALTDIKSATLTKYKSSSAISNYNTFIEGGSYIDYKKVSEYISKITYEDFNQYIMSIYATANVSLAVEGKFDTRKCYTLLEVEKMLGNYSHVDMEDQFNAPKIEFTPIADPNLLAIENLVQQYTEQKQSEQSKTHSNTGVTIDNSPVK